MSSKELGFEQLEQHFIDEYKSTATLYWHQKTGADIMSVTNEDEIRSLALSFTPHRK
jgi:Zn-dependent M16 (insulinase) family peptidase